MNLPMVLSASCVRDPFRPITLMSIIILGDSLHLSFGNADWFSFFSSCGVNKKYVVHVTVGVATYHTCALTVSGLSDLYVEFKHKI